MKFFGIWSDWAGGFIDTDYMSPEDAQVTIDRLFIPEGEDPEDLHIYEQCPEHLDSDQIAGSCDICDTEE